MEQITVVIGDRLGKGQKVAAGVEKAGGRAVVVPGVAADMKLGDVMKAENATFGISFCGSGGAGAITAQNKHGYKAKYGMRSVDEGVTAINEGCNVLGFGFMDKEELGGAPGAGVAKEIRRLMMKEQFTTTVRVKGKGDAKARAFADALNHVQSAVMRESPYILLRIEPQDVRIVQAHESVRKEAFLFFFLRRERRTYSVELDVTVNVTAINLDRVDFVAKR
ncbi:putative cytoplasmic protein [Salmonella enterica subsp. enterica serovar Heidelberg]|nr:putative cytoplasmic protein [Salmonella enterica subsp. enterica serovar Heidelberg]